MTTASTLFSHIGHRLPELILIVTVLAVVVILLLTFLTSLAMKKASENAPKDPKPKVKKERIISEYKMPPIGGWIARFLTLKGFFRVGDVSVSFLRALEFLRGHFDTLTYKYHLPWYLMVGPGGAGKSTLLEGMGMSLPVGMPDFGIKSPHPACRWWFYNRAVVLDIHGSLVMEENKAISDEHGWRSILSLLGRYRAKRPLDGIILALPATELYGRNQLSLENLNARAKFLSQKLIAAQHLLGLRLPVYVMVTKCDVIPGFQNFCHELPQNQVNSMLGWSVPHALHSAYTPHWVDEAFHSMTDALFSLRLEMFAHGVAEENKDGIFIFSQELNSIKNNLGLYLDHIFKGSAYEECLMLRGIYCCGDSGIQFLPPNLMIEEEFESDYDYAGQQLLKNSETGEPSEKTEPTLSVKFKNKAGQVITQAAKEVKDVAKTVEETVSKEAQYVSKVVGQEVSKEVAKVSEAISAEFGEENIDIGKAAMRDFVKEIGNMGRTAMGDIGQRFREAEQYLIQKRPATAEESQYYDTTYRHIFFGKEVFENKIFFESGLAYPIYSRLVSANRNLNLSKAGIVAFVGIGTFGMLNAYENFIRNRDFLMPVFGKISSVLSQLPSAQASESHAAQVLFEEQAKSLLEMMSELQKTSFFSFFIPSSWFSPLHDHLNSSLKISYEQIILRTIYMDLLLKARATLTVRFDPMEKTSAIRLLLSPTKTLEYKRLKTYVDQMDLLNVNVEKYNRLRKFPDPHLLTDLVGYTFNVRLPTEFSSSFQKFYKVLRESPYPEIDLKAYDSVAQSSFMKLYSAFLSILFSPNDPKSLLGQLRYLTTNIGTARSTQSINLDLIRGFSEGIEQSSPTSSLAAVWIDGPYFDPGEGFSDMMGKISDISAFGADFIDRLAQQTSLIYNSFHQELMQMNRILIPLMPGVPNKLIPPSESILNLQKNFSLLLNESFMAKTNGEMFITQIPESQVVFWNKPLIEAAVEMIKHYETFAQKGLDVFPVHLREIIKLIALQNLQKNIVSYIAKAQTLTDAPQTPQIGDAREQLLRNKIGDVKDIIPPFLKLLDVLNSSNSGTIFVNLQNLLGTLSTRLLKKVDELLIAYIPYAVRDNNFDWWDGSGGVFFQGFDVKDTEDLKAYLDQQRQSITHLAIDFAQPMVTFLGSEIMQGFMGNKALVGRWSRIIDQLSRYDKHRPESSVSSLENFVLKDTSNLTMNNCFQKIPLTEIGKASGDFFLNRRLQLKRALLARCEVAKRHDTIKNYQALATFFNESLREKFPFVGPNASQSQGEVDPEDIKKFFALYRQFGDSPKAILEQIYQLGEEAKNPYIFLREMEIIKEFFHSYLTSALPSDVPSFDFNINFRVNKVRETGGNQIIDWTFSPDDTTTIKNTMKNKAGRWTYGNQVVMSFRWPDAAETQPFLDKAQPFMAVDEQKVTFTYPGQWAIFWMLRAQEAQSSDFQTLKDTKPYTLRFEIPNGPDEKTLVFNQIVFRAPSKGKAPGKILKIPTFPTEAPPLDQKILDVADKPVIVQGLVPSHTDITEEIEAAEKQKRQEELKKPEPQEKAPAEEAPAPEAPE